MKYDGSSEKNNVIMEFPNGDMLAIDATDEGGVLTLKRSEVE